MGITRQSSIVAGSHLSRKLEFLSTRRKVVGGILLSSGEGVKTDGEGIRAAADERVRRYVKPGASCGASQEQTNSANNGRPGPCTLSDQTLLDNADDGG